MSTLRFTIQDNDGKVVFGTEKVSNWEEIEQNIVRSKLERGRVRKITNTFSFVDDIRTRMIRNFDNYGNNAKVTLLIEIGNDNRDAFSYSRLGCGLPLKGDFSKIEINELSCQLNFNDSDFQEKISSRKSEKLNITQLNTLEGTEATDYNTLLKSVWMHDRTLQLNSELSAKDPDVEFDPVFGDYVGWQANNTHFDNSFESFILYKSDDNLKQTNNLFVGDKNNIPIESLFYLLSDIDRQLNLSFNFDMQFISIYANVTGTFQLNIDVFENGSAYDFKETIQIGEFNMDDYSFQLEEIYPGFFRYAAYDSLNESLTININEGESLLFYYSPPSGGSDFGLGINYKTYEFKINSTEYFDATTSNCLLPHEFFTHYIELMTCKKNAFYSEFFGRTDIGYDEDGEGAYFSIMDGHMIRNLPISENPFNASFKDILEDLIKIYNLVGQIEYIGDTEVYRIEPYSQSFNTQTIIDLNELVKGVSRKQDKETTYSNIKIGYKDLVPENLNGLDIYNGEVNYSVPLGGIDNELNLVCKGITADYIIEQTRRKQYSIAPNEDTKYDKNIFYVEAKKGNTTDVISKKAEDYEDVTGIIAPLEAYNLGITPAKMLRNWGNVVKGSLLNIQNPVLTLTKSASNNTLTTKKSGEDAISEGSDIDVNKLDNAIFINEVLNIEEAPVSKEQWSDIEDNPNGIVKFKYKGFNFYGTINNASFDINNETANFELKRSNR